MGEQEKAIFENLKFGAYLAGIHRLQGPDREEARHAVETAAGWAFHVIFGLPEADSKLLAFKLAGAVDQGQSLDLILRLRLDEARLALVCTLESAINWLEEWLARAAVYGTRRRPVLHLSTLQVRKRSAVLDEAQRILLDPVQPRSLTRLFQKRREIFYIASAYRAELRERERREDRGGPRVTIRGQLRERLQGELGISPDRPEGRPQRELDQLAVAILADLGALASPAEAVALRQTWKRQRRRWRQRQPENPDAY